MNRWDWIEDIKAVTPGHVAVRELGKVLADELGAWPPEVEWCDEGTRQRFAEILAPTAPSPSTSALAESLKLVRWELGHDFEAIDQYQRNHHLEKACPAQADQLACSFLQSYFIEAFLELIERTDNRVMRSDLTDGIDKLETRIKQAWQQQN